MTRILLTDPVTGRRPRGAAGWRRRLASLTVLTLLVAFFHGSPARAEEPATSAPADRSLVVQAWFSGGAQVRAMAEVALTGTDDQVREFLTTGREQAAGIDQRETVASAVLDAGPSLRAAAEAALAAHDAGDASALANFVSTGRLTPETIDLRVRVNQLMASGGAQVQEAAQQALDSEDPAVLQEFLNSGWQTQWQTDLRLQVNGALATGGPQVQVAAQKALDAGTPAALDQFLSYDWDVAAAHDDEVADLEGLLALAKEAAATVDRETKNAQEQGKRAADGAAAAQRSADEAAAATERARGNAAEAKAHAKRGARAARKAAQAAQVALDSAAAADRAAKTAVRAANRAYWAAGKAADAASDAYRAASTAVVDGGNADAASKAADKAVAISKATTDLATRAGAAAAALQLVQDALISAEGAAYNARAAADSSDEAQKYANLTGSAATEARAAAAEARANADRALRALASAKKYMQIAISNALAARDAANEAAKNALAAAKAARDAVTFAGNAAQAAVKATEHADAAVTAATKVVDLGTQALAVYNAARDADTERLAVATDAALASARDLNAQYEANRQQADWDADQATKRDAETDQLIAVARNTATDPATALVAARKAALTLAQGPGVWTKQAAIDALSADDDLEVLAFARTRLDRAVAQDNRIAVAEIAASDNAALSQAAITALAGTDAAVATFLQTQNYTGRFTQDRMKVNQILANAKAAGRTLTVQRAQAALDAETLQALRDFLDTGQFEASATDDRLQVNQLIADPGTGPEVKAAAQVALEGPAALLPQFLKTGRYQAAERDYSNAVHLATVGGLMDQINELGATAVQHAQEAQSVAAKARGDATKATEYANQAIASATKAAGYATKAAEWATKAAESANSAIKSAATAQNAAMAANKSAHTALRASAWADALHEQAKANAKNADYYADEAAKAAKNAGKDVEAIQQAADEADDLWRKGVVREAAKCYAENSNKLPVRIDGIITGGSVADNCLKNAIADPDELIRRAYANTAWCMNLYPQGPDSADFKNCRNSTLDPNFEWLSLLEFSGKIVTGLAVMLTPALVVGAVGCLLVQPCGAVVGTLLTIGDIGTTIYQLIKGDKTFAAALKDVGITLVEGLVFAGAAKLTSTAFRGLKSVYEANKLGSKAQSTLSGAALQQLRLQVERCSAKNSFTADTEVLLADGSNKPIAEIQVGDLVLATDPEADETAGKRVDARDITTDHEFTDVTVKTPGGPLATIHTTTHHPIWSHSERRWIDAGSLGTDNQLRTPNGDPVSVSGVRSFTGSQQMYNLTVAETPTFYVLAGTTPVLVHNFDCFGLTEIGDDWWRSPAGLDYGRENGAFDHRIFHVLAHTVADPTKDKHSVFNLKNALDVFKLIDEGWSLRATKTVWINDSDPLRPTYYINMGRQIGTRSGENYLRITVEHGNEVITAFPSVRPPQAP